jgi:uncharacterized delta-60 repeat protein
MKKIILLITVFTFCSIMSYAQPGSLDSSFGGKGWVTEEFIKTNFYYESISQIFPEENNSFIAVVTGLNGGPNALIHFFSNGMLDNSFGTGGYLFTNVAITKTAQQIDRKILVAGQVFDNNVPGSYVFNLTRYSQDGNIDSSFASNGRQSNNFKVGSIAVQSNGKILVTSTPDNDFAIARYNSDGSPDLSLNGDGKLTDDSFDGTIKIYSVGVQNDGKIIVAGTILVPDDCTRCGDGINKLVLIRYSNDGSLDNSFGDHGKVMLNFDFEDSNTAGSIFITLKNEKITLASSVYNGSNFDIALTRYNSNGSPDINFNIGGQHPADFGRNDFPSSLTIQNDGKILVAAWTGGLYEEEVKDFALVRYNSDGTLDNNFDDDGKLTTDFGFNDFANSVLVQNDGKIIMAGGTTLTRNWDFALARYNSNGSLDNVFADDGKKIGYVPVGVGELNNISIQSRKIVVAGQADDTLNQKFFISRYNLDGSIDSTFGENGKQTTGFGNGNSFMSSNTLVIQNDGKIVVGGFFRQNPSNFAISRYNVDGTLDSSFSEDGKKVTNFGNYAFTEIYALAVQKDDKIVVAGAATDVSFNSHLIIVRYNPDGSLDKTFSGDGILINDFGIAFSLAIQDDGKILVAGPSTVSRFNSDGSPDLTFSAGGTQTTVIYARRVVVQNDGKILVGGSFVNNGNEDFGIARFNSDGSIDKTFNQTGVLSAHIGMFSSVDDIDVQPDGRIILSGIVYSDLNFRGDVLILRLNSDGSYDNGFGSNGQVVKDFGGDERGYGSVIYNNSLYVAGKNIISAYVLSSAKFPQVNITHPVDRSRHTAPAYITLSADATDADGTIQKVDFYNGPNLIFTEDVAPYQRKGYVITEPGTYSLTAKATDNDGNVTTSDVVNITVVPNKPPTVKITHPLDRSKHLAPAYITLSADATDVDGSIKKVDFYNGTKLIYTETVTPYQQKGYVISEPGNYSLIAKATDNSGNVTTSEVVNIFVLPNTPQARNILSASRENDNTIDASNDNSKSNKNSKVDLTIAPNPANNILNIYTTGLQRNKQATISVISSTGVVMKTKQLSSSTQTTQLNVSSLKSGVYIIKLVSGDEILYRRFVKL